VSPRFSRKEQETNMSVSQQRKPSVVRDLLAGSVAGICSIFVCHPFDVIRVRLQTDAGVLAATAKSAKTPGSLHTAAVREYKGAIDCIKQTIQREGVLSLYRGLAMPLAAQAVYKSVIFGTFSATSQLATAFNTHTNRKPELSRIQVALCGGCAGAVNAFVVAPVELARNRLVLERATCQTKMRYKGPIDVLRHVRLTEGGIPALFQGIGVTVLRDALGIALYFSVFRTLHPLTQEWFGAGDVRASLMAGGMAGVSFWSVALPLDAIKTVIQTDAMLLPQLGIDKTGELRKQRGIWEVGKEMAKEKRLYRGWALAFSRGLPSAAIVFAVQDKVRSLLERV
jgi:solute carrier family 25 carnitine/acylcarnitine transporter 20/29